jgi:hypothetical protein
MISRAKVALLVLLGVAGATIFVPSDRDVQAATKTPLSPRGKIVMINQNLREWIPNWNDDVLGFPALDLEHHRELTNLARRLDNRLAYAPDVIVTQETNRGASRTTARKLTAATGRTYRSKVDPFATFPEGKKARPLPVRNTSVIVNTDTMKFIRGGYLRVEMPPGSEDPDEIRRSKDQAYALLKERKSHMLVVAMAVHFPPSWYFVDRQTSAAVRTQWVTEIASFVKDQFPRADIVGFAGEYNQRRCRHYPERVDCNTLKWWERLNSLGYRDAVFSTHNGSDEKLQSQTVALGSKPGAKNRRWKRIDFTFVKGVIFSAARDMAYDVNRLEPRYISDHRWDKSVYGKRVTRTSFDLALGQKIGVDGTVKGAKRGGSLKVKLSRKTADGSFEDVSVKELTLRAGGDFHTVFVRRRGDRCRIKAHFPETKRALTSRRSKSFAC